MSRNLKSTLEILNSQEDLGHGSEWDHDLIIFLFLREKNLVTVRKAKRAEQVIAVVQVGDAEPQTKAMTFIHPSIPQLFIKQLMSARYYAYAGVEGADGCIR